MKKLIWSLVLMAAFFAMPLFSLRADAQEAAAQEGTILKGIYIDDIDVSGMTETEAKKLVEESVNKRLNTTLSFSCVDGNVVTVSAKDLGMTWRNSDIVKSASSAGQVGDVITRYKFRKDIERESIVFETSYGYDEEKIRSIVEKQCKAFDVEARNYSLKRENGAFSVVDGCEGQVIDEEAAIQTITDFVSGEWDGREATISLPIITEKPLGNAEELASVTDLLGSFSTSFSTSGASRVANVENGCRLLNGVTLYPGEEYSTLERVTPFSVANGYQMAGSYLNGMVVDSLGGGICQVSTTLYNAVLKAELEVTERYNHSMSVSYVPLSADAAIAESAGKDFCFKNNLEYPVYIEGYVSPERVITFNIYGKETRPSGRSVEYVSEVLSSTAPDRENIVQTAAQPIGFTNVQSAHIGYKARLIKVVYENGVEKSRQNVNTSNYKMVPRTLTVGTATANPDHANQLQAAIATGSIDHVRQVAGALAAQEQVVETVAPDI